MFSFNTDQPPLEGRLPDIHEQIHKAKAEKARARVIKEEMDAKRAKTKAARERRQERIAGKRDALTAGDETEEKKPEA